MINFNANIPPLLQKFLNKFNPCFSKPTFISFCFYVSGLFIELKRTNIQSIVLKSPNAHYENIQYFLSEAKWDTEQLNNIRINILQANRTTKSSKKGVLVIDDSGCQKWGFKTEGVAVQHYGTENIQTKCNIVVVSAFSDPSKRYPINLKPYKPKQEFFLKDSDPDFKSKHQLAMELISDAISKNISFSDIVFDNWYFSNELVEFVQDNNLFFITGVESSRLISFRGKWVHADELVKLIPPHKLKAVTVPSSSDFNKFWTYSFYSKLKDLQGKFLIVVSIGKWNKDDPKNVHVFVSNHLSYSAQTILSKYSLRWGIERIFRDLKDNLAFDHYQVRSLKSISRHWHLACLAYSFLLISKFNGSFSRIFNQKPTSVGNQLTFFRKINSFYQIPWIKNNPQNYQIYLGLENYLSRNTF